MKTYKKSNNYYPGKRYYPNKRYYPRNFVNPRFHKLRYKRVFGKYWFRRDWRHSYESFKSYPYKRRIFFLGFKWSPYERFWRYDIHRDRHKDNFKKRAIRFFKLYKAGKRKVKMIFKIWKIKPLIIKSWVSIRLRKKYNIGLYAGYRDAFVTRQASSFIQFWKIYRKTKQRYSFPAKKLDLTTKSYLSVLRFKHKTFRHLIWKQYNWVYVRRPWRKNRKWKWNKILRWYQWKWNRPQRIKKREYYLRIWKRALYKRINYKPENFLGWKFLDYNNFMARRLEQFVFSFGDLKYFKLSQVAIKNGVIWVNNKVNRNPHYIVNTFDSIRVGLPSSYFFFRTHSRKVVWKCPRRPAKKNAREIKKRAKKERERLRRFKRNKFSNTDGMLRYTPFRLFQVWRNDPPQKRASRVKYLPNYYNYKMLCVWK